MVAAPDAAAQGFTARPLTPATWADLEALFGLPAGSIVRGCWCLHYRKTGTREWAPAEDNSALRDLVDSGVIPGLIGYLGDQPAGWISLGRCVANLPEISLPSRWPRGSSLLSSFPRSA